MLYIVLTIDLDVIICIYLFSIVYRTSRYYEAMVYDNANIYIYIYVEKYTYKRNARRITKHITQYLHIECNEFSFLYLYFDLHFDFH